MFKWIGLIVLAGLIGGCASFNTLNNEVSTFGSWPAERNPASYGFERLPSQQERPEQQQLLEDAANGALQRAGFALGRHLPQNPDLDQRQIDPSISSQLLVPGRQQ